MKVIAGRYTLALATIICGAAMLLNNLFGIGALNNLWVYSPGILIVFGIEVLALSFIYRRKENVKVEFGTGNIFLIAGVVAIFMIGTASIDIHDPVLENLYKLSYYVKNKI